MENQHTSEQIPTKKLKKKLIIVASIILCLLVLLGILYLVAEDAFINLAAGLVGVLILSVSVLIITSPFLYFKKKYDGLTRKSFFISIIIALPLTGIVVAGFFYLQYLALAALGRGLLSTF